MVIYDFITIKRHAGVPMLYVYMAGAKSDCIAAVFKTTNAMLTR